MKYYKLSILIAIAALFVTGCSTPDQTESSNEPRALYTYSFGGLEDLKVADSVALLERLGYAGVAAEGRGEESLERLEQYLDLSEQQGDDFLMPAAYMAHRFSQFGFDDSAQRAAIDRLEGTADATL